MTDRRQINIKIREEKAKKWEKHHEENSEYSSLTDLIRQSVEKEIKRDGNSPSATGVSDNMEKDMAGMKDRISSLQRNIELLTDTVSDLRTEMRDHDVSDKHLRSEIFAALPYQNDMQGPATPEEMADKLGGPIDKHTTSKILEQLAKDVGSVEGTIGRTPEDPDKYYKIE